jgi:uncharacterized membrane protein
MLVTAVYFWQIVTAIHVIAVVGAFGFVMVYPFVASSAGRIDSRALSALHQSRQQIGRLLVNPGLVLILISGIYLASDLHDWKQFFTQWGIAMVVVLGGLEGAVVMRQERRLAELAETQVTAGASAATLSPEYVKARNLSQRASWVMSILVIVTIYFMAVHA